MNKPDGNRGWASYLLQKGYEVYLVDQWGVGRSSKNDLDVAPSILGGGVRLAEVAFTAPERFNNYYQARFHTQWPGVSVLLYIMLCPQGSKSHAKSADGLITERNKGRSNIRHLFRDILAVDAWSIISKHFKDINM